MNAARTLAAALLALAAFGAQAGQACVDEPLDPSAVTRGMALAERTRQALDATGAQVVVLARAGQNLGAYGVRWSHLGYAYRDADAQGRPVWRVLHKLNTCGSADAALYRQGLGEFFMDRPWRYEAAYAVPAPAVQQALLPVLRDNGRAAQWNERRYNLVAYPWAQRYQQSNQWAIETLAGAMEPAAATRRQAQAWLQLKGYEPAVLHVNAFERLGARIGSANVAFDDQPDADRYADRIATVTADSVFAWLRASGLGGDLQVLR